MHIYTNLSEISIGTLRSNDSFDINFMSPALLDSNTSFAISVIASEHSHA